MRDLAARCAAHPDAAATATCTRCGTFICALDTGQVDGVVYCTTCSVRPDVDRIEAYRVSCAGKRSVIEWAFVLAVPLQLTFGIATLFEVNRLAPRVVAALAVVSAFNGMLWFGGRPIARMLHLGLTGAWAAGGVALLWHEGLAPLAFVFAGVAIAGFAPLIAVRSKLFFGLPVQREELRRLFGVKPPAQ